MIVNGTVENMGRGTRAMYSNAVKRLSVYEAAATADMGNYQYLSIVLFLILKMPAFFLFCMSHFSMFLVNRFVIK
ncbi:hypothetical protein SAMN05421821_10295 [Mucilaginibacter lappiensis]|uniref:Uncharacterized protein n=1 Tax=Mucilaginibacter lappiensis TaxID=354630 RepID=A0ABR6PFX7_9SPHI|nr:hypothetical protein [Mucilaginibacter lappiensis]SIQ28485.1 hypothetical protein SAMN05421821_10295 [Mucilaginibacter lappiensis]